MPRRAFVADLQEAIESFTSVNVSKIKPGEDDGQVVFQYSGKGVSTEIIALVPDLGNYPESHDYMFFTNADSVHPDIHQAMDSLPQCPRRKVYDMLTKVVGLLDKAVASRDDGQTVLREDGAMDIDSDSDVDAQEDTEEEDSDSDNDVFTNKPPRLNFSKSTSQSHQTQQALRRRIRHDLSLAKKAKFRVSCLGNLQEGSVDGFVTLSIRISKLGISEEALAAWDLDQSQYFMVIIRYSAGYQTFEQLVGSHRAAVDLRVGLTKKYKISIDDAVSALIKSEETSRSKKKLVDGGETAAAEGLARLFIRGPLEELLNDRLIPLLKYRVAMGFPWLGAEEFYNDHQGRNVDSLTPDVRYWREEDSKTAFESSDHLTSNEKQLSFPTLAMQFALRHLTRCTEFCLVCHRQIEANFEALKPYVCSNPLCLYQYMSLGFGPSIEHEIISQSWVVDLLISFCYNSAYSRRLKDLPNGMALMVPPATAPAAVREYQNQQLMDGGQLPAHPGSVVPITAQAPVPEPPPLEAGMRRARYDRQLLELLCDTNEPHVPLSAGSWITLWSDTQSSALHFQVKEVVYPIFRLSKPLSAAPPTDTVQKMGTTSKSFYAPMSTVNSTPGHPGADAVSVDTEASKSAYERVSFAIWNVNFDDLDDNGKFSSICLLLDTLPTVPDMKSFLQSRGDKDVTLRQWERPIPSGALGLLRWIIASNRSCIVQVDGQELNSKRTEERVCGMPGWLQFRFAQGAPDKEQRFITSINTTTATAKHPTIFAWHGSPLYNWHGIVREGLHFKNKDHGRAFGHGVYHAMDCATSLNYTGSRFGFVQPPPSHSANPTNPTNLMPGQWFNSELRISSAIALNEIINAPANFVSSNPYLVVAQLDWIQTRYLFVKCNKAGFAIQENSPQAVYEQDPRWCPKGSAGQNIILPRNVVSKSRRPASPGPKSSEFRGNKRVKLESLIELSDDTDVEDLAIFLSDAEPEIVSVTTVDKSQVSKQAIVDISKTDFTPGSLQIGSLTLLEPPRYATSAATKALTRELQATLKIQDSNPLHQLGWYIDRENVNNVYQWIVELHSFDKDLPLAKDMKKQNITSIVMEFRFGAQYPMSPPFVRIIRPRFLGFNQGGGGHVTLGGALCMELLTNTGWSAVSNIESVLLQVRLAMSSLEPRPARLDFQARGDYRVGEAVEAFIRACKTHGWEVPPDFRSNYGSSLSIPAPGL